MNTVTVHPQRSRLWILIVVGLCLLALSPTVHASQDQGEEERHARLNARLKALLTQAGFTGSVEQTLETRLGRPLDPKLTNLGRLLFFDNINGLHDDNSCAGCHTPAFGFGDSQSIAIGVQSNRIVGLNRAGPRNQRRTPSVMQSGFYPKLMWNGRFFSHSGDPFDNSLGFHFPQPEGDTLCPPNDPHIKTLLAAQGHIPQTELVEMGGFTGTKGTITPEFDPFDDGLGTRLPPPDASGFRNDPMRALVLERFNTTPGYLKRFGKVFNDGQPFPPGDITFAMIGSALAEFQMSLTFTDSPLDRFARGEQEAMTASQKRGAVLFFGKANCVACHAVAGQANEMFSDFDNHVVGVPQIAPQFGVGTGNVIFDGPGRDEDFGAEHISGDPQDRYKFRTSPLRNVAVQSSFFHNGAFTTLEDAVRFHLNPIKRAPRYDPMQAGVDEDLTHRLGPMDPVLERLDPLLKQPVKLTGAEFHDVIAFLREGIFDPPGLAEEAMQTRATACAQRTTRAHLRGLSTVIVPVAIADATSGEAYGSSVCPIHAGLYQPPPDRCPSGFPGAGNAPSGIPPSLFS